MPALADPYDHLYRWVFLTFLLGVTEYIYRNESDTPSRPKCVGLLDFFQVNLQVCRHVIVRTEKVKANEEVKK